MAQLLFFRHVRASMQHHFDSGFRIREAVVKRCQGYSAQAAQSGRVVDPSDQLPPDAVVWRWGFSAGICWCIAVATTEHWDDHGLEHLLCWLEFSELLPCGAVSKRWCSILLPAGRPTGLPWRQAVVWLSGSSFSVREVQGPGLLARWPGIEVFLPTRELSNSLVALPLGARPIAEALPIQSWPGIDCRSLIFQTLSWPVSAYTHPERSTSNSFFSGKCLPLCPLCAGVAFYQGSGFTRADIATGWHGFLLCNLGPCSERSLLLSTLFANMGVTEDMVPNIAVQLRPASGEEEEAAPVEDATGDVAPGLDARGEMGMEIIDSFSTLWRGPKSSMAQNIISIALPCSFRLRIAGICLAELGIMAFFCEQVNKTACTSRTRVGRYLDDQPARMPRAHVFGTRTSPSCVEWPDWLPPNSLKFTESDASEPCPYCGASGFLLNSAVVSVLSWEAEKTALAFQPVEAEQAFHGSLWVCSSHLWGWRWRRAGLLVTSE